ncbi:SH3 domain-containing protein [Methyloligella solikamskensis]|uniref:SH3 domain-containing protein n=1 Tax=Methyloligella solikamskensis TaxID=1177756 RepID=A0ABW3JEU8_9HYPH
MDAPRGSGEDLTPDAIARHIAPEPPRHLSERPRAAGPVPGQPNRAAKPKQSGLLSLWDRNPILVAGVGAGGMVLFSLLVVGVASLFSSEGPILPGKTIEGRFAEEAQADLESMSAPPAEAATPPAQQTAAVTPELSTSSMIEMEPATAIPLPISIDPENAVPARSAVAIVGLPEGAQLSAGRPYGNGEWTVRTDEIRDLAITVPPGTSGSHDLRIALVDAQGGVIADANTTLVIQGGAAAQTVSADAEQSTQPDPTFTQQMEPASDPAETASVEQDAAAPSEQPQPAASLGPPSEDGVADAADGKWMEVTTAVNMRAEPDSDAQTVSVMPQGKRLKVTEDKFGWLRVSDPDGGQGGWIYKRFLKDAE